MVLVDTSVWINHLRFGDKALITLLNRTRVAVHPMIVGELACGNLQNREHILTSLKRLPALTEVSHDEALYCLEKNDLMESGIGYVDLHLLAATLVSSNTSIWTHDKRLQQTARDLGISWRVPH